VITHIDIEGTTSSTWFVQRTLYPYSRERFAEYLATHRDRPDVDQKMTSELGVPPDRIVFLSDLSGDTPKLVTA